MSKIVPAKRGQFLWLSSNDPAKEYCVVDVLAWELDVSEYPVPITPTGRIDPMVRCVLASAAGWHAFRDGKTFRSSHEVLAYLRQDAT
jgi:hypothetical protein